MVSCEQALEYPPPPPSGLPMVLVAAALLIDKDGRVLVAQRPEGKSMAGLWEFPGGKVEAGEGPEFALMRELREELDIETRPCGFYPITFASHSYEKFHLMMPLFACRVWRGIVQGKEGQSLKWIRPMELYDLEMPAADIPLIPAIIDYL
jgi:8-oxo-dGTP diphosphatase